jgi:carboxyl-terminal processing protease
MIRGMLQASGDEYAIFLEPTIQELEADSLEGNFGGIGVELKRADNGDLLLFPYPDSPAALAGVQTGDKLLAVDGLEITADMPIETVQAAIRGEIDKIVRITVRRESEQVPFQIEIRRKEIALPSVTWILHPEVRSIGIIKINIIAASTPGEIVRAVTELQKSGATAFVLDLRENGGGLLSESIEIVRLFLTQGDILKQQYRGQPVETFSVEKPGPLVDTELAVLVNNNTASAAEIIAGALNANRRATIIGSPTFGKDSIQLVFNLEDGSSMHITAARWWVPGLSPAIGEGGLQPDILILPETPGSDPALAAAVKLLTNGQ